MHALRATTSDEILLCCMRLKGSIKTKVKALAELRLSFSRLAVFG